MAASQTETKKTETFNPGSLKEAELKDFQFVQKRIKQLQETRINHYGKNLDQIWADADRDYIPHRLYSTGKKVVATDEDKGWRGAMVTLGSNDWQSDLSQSNVFIKVQTALSILVDQNPSGVFTPTTKKYQPTSELIKQLYDRSWDYAKSKSQLKLFIYNLAKYGWAAARTYPLRITRKVKVIVKYNEEKPEDSVYETKEVTVYNDLTRENLDVRNVWMDDMAKPNNPYSIKDWAWRKIYDIDVFQEEFGTWKNAKFVQPGGITDEVIGVTNVDKPNTTKDTGTKVEVLFYENILKDLFVVIANGVPVILDPLPISDSQGNKKLSLWQTFWNLRHSESPYGIGIYEAIRYDQAMIDRFRNMTIDQITLSIYKMFFYQGTQALTETGNITIQPGVGKQVLDPKNVNFMEVPGPGKDAYDGIEMFNKDIDKSSGITDPLSGEITGKTAFELAQAKESALKRMKDPLDNILEALNNEGYITVSLIQLIYSIPETYKITDEALINDYLQEVQSDPDLFERDEQGAFTAKVYPEFPLNLGKDEKGNLIETKDTRFFRIKPDYLQWEGIINIKSQSLLVPSKQIEKALYLEMSNALMPMLGSPDPAAAMKYGKLAKQLVKEYDKDPKDYLPDDWINPQPAQPMGQGLIIPAGPQGGSGVPGQPQTTAPQQPGSSGQQGPPQPAAVPMQTISQQPKGIAQSVMSKISGKSNQV